MGQIHPDGEIHLGPDNYATHTHQAVKSTCWSPPSGGSSKPGRKTPGRLYGSTPRPNPGEVLAHCLASGRELPPTTLVALDPDEPDFERLFDMLFLTGPL
ncbi:MAG TPA: hypothetical protein VIL08_04690 [Limnochorda sp.]